jgi:hypothetical protein
MIRMSWVDLRESRSRQVDEVDSSMIRMSSWSLRKTRVGKWMVETRIDDTMSSWVGELEVGKWTKLELASMIHMSSWVDLRVSRSASEVFSSPITLDADRVVIPTISESITGNKRRG